MTEMTDIQNRITVTVKSFATLREVMDAQIRVDLPKGASIRSLLGELTRRYDGLNDLLFAAPGILRDFVNILKNGRNVEFLGRLYIPPRRR